MCGDGNILLFVCLEQGFVRDAFAKSLAEGGGGFKTWQAARWAQSK